jgi:sugar O-acyltransferase (sialic acid O-acetyltransferase NeuD family)
MVGFGALGRQVMDLLAAGGLPGRVVYFDDELQRRKAEDSYPFEAYLDEAFAGCAFYVGLGYRHLGRKARILEELRAAGRRTPALVHPSAQVHPSCRVGEGCVVYPLVNLGAGTMLEPGVLLNNSVVVSHDSRVGPSAYLSPGVVLSGHVSVSAEAFLGAGVVVADGRRIGAGARVGIGTVVTADVPDGASAIGNPMRLLDRPLDLG